eukprot:gene15581-biopygen21722
MAPRVAHKKWYFQFHLEQQLHRLAGGKMHVFGRLYLRKESGVWATVSLCSTKSACPVERCHSGCGLPERLLAPVGRHVLMGATQKTQEIIKNAGNHAGYRPGIACRGCNFGSMLEDFTSILASKTAKSGLKDAPQRRGYTRSLPMGPIDDCCATELFFNHFGCKAAICLPVYWNGKTPRCLGGPPLEPPCFARTASLRRHGLGARCRRRCGKSPPWVAQVVVEQYIGMECAPLKGPIDGTHGCAQKMVFLVPTGEAVKPCARPKDAYFRSAATRFQAGVRLTLILFNYQAGQSVGQSHCRAWQQLAAARGHHGNCIPGSARRGTVLRSAARRSGAVAAAVLRVSALRCAAWRCPALPSGGEPHNPSARLADTWVPDLLIYQNRSRGWRPLSLLWGISERHWAVPRPYFVADRIRNGIFLPDRRSNRRPGGKGTYRFLCTPMCTIDGTHWERAGVSPSLQCVFQATFG